jgi:uncharacterized protein YdhG (YjbR/CyaY superfamily)
MADRFESVDAYIAAQPEAVQQTLEQVRRTIHDAVPGLGEKISYSMPMLTLAGRNLVSFAAWKKHVGLYPIPAGDDAFAAAIAPYRDAKSTARFPLSEPMPLDVIARMAVLLADERGSARDPAAG